MPWMEVSTMSSRREFIELALQEGRNMARLCVRFEISRKTGYKWLARYTSDGAGAHSTAHSRKQKETARNG